MTTKAKSTFAYKVLVFVLTPNGLNDPDAATVDALGEQGWELLSAQPMPDPRHNRVLFTFIKPS